MFNIKQANSLSLGLREAGVIFIAVILSYVLVEVAVDVSMSATAEWLSHERTVRVDVGPIRLAVAGIIDPWATLLVVLVGLKGYFKRESISTLLSEFGFSGAPSTRTMIYAFLVGVGVNLAFSLLGRTIFLPPISASPHPVNALNSAPQLLLLAFSLSGATIVPVVEEYLFRGVLFAGLAQRFNPFFSAVFVTVIFIALHQGNISSGYWLTHLYFVAISVLLIVARVVSKALYIPVFLHSGLNFSELFF